MLMALVRGQSFENHYFREKNESVCLACIFLPFRKHMHTSAVGDQHFLLAEDEPTYGNRKLGFS